jgi:hypothetical protein
VSKHNAHQRCLARTVWTKQAVHAAALSNKVDFAERVARSIPLRHADGFECSRRHRRASCDADVTGDSTSGVFDLWCLPAST